MRKLFYTLLGLSMMAVSCSTDKAGDQGELAKASENVALGKAGKFTFQASDGLEVTADYYPNEQATKIIILCHQADFSRGAYKDIAPKLVAKGYACVAVDLRSGKMANEILNETAENARRQKITTTYSSARQDIISAIDYISSHTDKEIILWGSSYSAALSLVIGASDDRVKKIIAFSPGEFLENQNTVKPAVVGISKPVFITGSSSEYDLIVQPIADVMPKQSTTFVKQTGQSDHGSKTLDLNNSNSKMLYEKLFDFLAQ